MSNGEDMSERIIIEYSTFGPGDTYQYTIAATVSDTEAFYAALTEVANEAVQNTARAEVDVEVDGIILPAFPVKEYLEDRYTCEVLGLDEWFERSEIENSTRERIDRLSGVVGAPPL